MIFNVYVICVVTFSVFHSGMSIWGTQASPDLIISLE